MENGERARRWDLVLPHRQRLLRLARTLVRDPGDAEACVQEALTRCVTFAGLDESNVVGFLVATTRRLCIDHHRGTARDLRVAERLTTHDVPEPGPDEAVCDRAEAAWVSQRLSDLPPRQRAVVLARAAGSTPQEIAERLAVSYKTVETLLYRVRTRARAELERAYALVALRIGRGPQVDWSALGATSFAVVAGASLLLVPPTSYAVPEGRPSPRVLASAGPAVQVAAPIPLTPPRVAARPRPTPSPIPRPPTGSPSATVRPVPPCPYPPYQPDPCVPPPTPPEPSASPTLGVPYLDCVRYGIDTRSGFDCYDSPTPSPSRSRDGRSQGGNR